MMFPPNPAVKCARCLYDLAFGYDRISRSLFGTNERKHKVYAWAKWHEWPTRVPGSSSAWSRLKGHQAPGTSCKVMTAEEHDRRRQERFSKKTRKELRTCLGKSIWEFIKFNKGNRHVPRLIGCDRDTFKRHFESLFEKGMSWDNYGTHWVVDHAIPVSKFDIFHPEERQKCYHYTNLQPLTPHENNVKHTRAYHKTNAR